MKSKINKNRQQEKNLTMSEVDLKKMIFRDPENIKANIPEQLRYHHLAKIA